ncbi:MAG: type II toxin-antitoxin system RelB/DinJ family antitoxin [Clostridia bacterium]|nr:type II toxin-antitoxin system RelB/DinJ family antitoxin [Clostridia bacterium]MDD4047927.1 type II toxin-antitoxin system RelB/DinJ family antitoxin [Clostridia bacterium]
MAKTTTLNIRIDPDTKEAAEKLFSNFGITITDAVNMFLHQSLLSDGLPFSVKIPQPNANTLAAMQDIENIINNKSPSSPQSVNDFFKEMNLDEKS